MSGQVSFDNVVFGYDPKKPVIKGLSADIKSGQRVAIVGPTGAGKTTLVNLLMRFYEVGEGAITIDGINIKDMRREDVRRMFGMVLQDTWLFSGSIRDNITYGAPNATETDMIETAKGAIIRMLLDSHNLNAVVTILDDTWQHILLKFCISANLLSILCHTDMTFIDEQRCHIWSEGFLLPFIWFRIPNLSRENLGLVVLYYALWVIPSYAIWPYETWKTSVGELYSC
jgi:ABC-type dipeptide/oligopeptide/nickel transport system ATPase component